ncbi:MAG TPA: hypothetical protein VGG33_10925, partial [Polyangia bacterium]
MSEVVPGAPGPTRDPVAEAARGEAELGRQLATLDYASLTPTPGTALAAAVWWNGLLRLGLSPPLVAVHDRGLVLSRARGVESGKFASVPRPPGPEATALSRYRALLETIADFPADATFDGLVGLRDELIVILLARLFGDLDRRSRAAVGLAGLLPVLPLASPLYHRPITELRRRHPPDWALGFLRSLADEQGIVLLRLQQTELGVFRLFGVAPGGAPDLPALYQLANTTGAGQI